MKAVTLDGRMYWSALPIFVITAVAVAVSITIVRNRTSVALTAAVAVWAQLCLSC